jgi:hypothetical protein
MNNPLPDANPSELMRKPGPGAYRLPHYLRWLQVAEQVEVEDDMMDTLEPIRYSWYEILKIIIVTMGVSYAALLIVCLFPAGRKGLREVSTQLGLTIGGSAAMMKAIAVVKQFLPR